MKAGRKWYLVDADSKVLGDLATQIATVLRGKHKPAWHPAVDCGDNVVVINAEKVKLTGKKELLKEYIHHTNYPKGIRHITAEKMRADHPERIIEKAVTGMIPRNRLRQHIVAKLKVYKGSEHPHFGQPLEPLN